MNYRMKYENLVLKCLNGSSRHEDFLALGDADYFDSAYTNFEHEKPDFNVLIGLGASIQRIWVLADKNNDLDIEINTLKQDWVSANDSKKICDLIDKIEKLIERLNLNFNL